jgi:hypothetical protein
MDLPTKTTMDLWYHYEEIAMHFNSLIIQFRLQLIGGVGALGTTAAYLIGGKVDDAEQRAWLRTVVSGGLVVLIVAAALMDLLYYDRLLRGAVAALLAFETQHPEIQMSTMIERNVGWAGNHAVTGGYLLMTTVLAGFTLWSFWNYRSERDGFAHGATRAFTVQTATGRCETQTKPAANSDSGDS